MTHMPTHGGCLVQLRGTIDESFDLRKLLLGLTGVTGPIVLDLDGVERITSFGVREFMKALKQFPSVYYCFVRCRSAIVSQFNMIVDFGGLGDLVTFYAPYLCAHCDEEFSVLIDLRQDYQRIQSMVPPDGECPTCKKRGEFDDIPEAYFSHVSGRTRPALPPAASAIIDDIGAGGRGIPFKVVKEVRDEVTALWMSGTLDRKARFKRVGDGLEGHVVIVTKDVAEITPEGVGELIELMKIPGPELYFARLPLTIAEAFADAFSATERGKVVSVTLPFACRACAEAVEIEADKAMVALRLSGGDAKMHCMSCGESLQSSIRYEEALNATYALPMAPPPPPITEYLQRNPNGPRSRESGTPASDLTGTSESHLIADYEVIRPLGAGGMAQVHLARKLGPGGFAKEVVLKRIHPHLARETQFVDMFLREARLAARISHPNVVQIYDLGQWGNDFFMVMEYVRGWDLNSILRLCEQLHTPVPVQLGCRIAANICAGLHAAHNTLDENGHSVAIIHRDVSPHNVIISHDGATKLTDFGIAKAADTLTNTPTGSVRGTLSYMAPEAARGKSDAIDCRSDIWSTAVLLQEMLTGARLFHRSTPAATLHAVLGDAIPLIAETRADVPPDLDEIVKKGLARDPDDRYQTAQELQFALEAFAASQQGPPAQLAPWLNTLFEAGLEAGRKSHAAVTANLTLAPKVEPFD